MYIIQCRIVIHVCNCEDSMIIIMMIYSRNIIVKRGRGELGGDRIPPASRNHQNNIAFTSDAGDKSRLKGP